MAVEGGGDDDTTTEYDTDPDDVKISLNMRRREASDDELDDDDGVADAAEREKNETPPPRSRLVAVDSDVESDDQGAAAEYDDDVEEGEEEEYYDEEYDEVEEREIDGEAEEEKAVVGTGNGVEAKRDEEVEGEGEGEGEGEKKEGEPFSVPTSGAFYMHDDRFRDNAGGRHRRTLGGRKLWESKDERKWGHDKFEELNMHGRHYDEGRRSAKGYTRGRGRGRGAGRGYARGGRIRGYSGDSNQNPAPEDVRGRGPRKYQPLAKNKNETLPFQNKESARPYEKNSHSDSGRMPASNVNSSVECEATPAKKVGSNLSPASLPFYPSASSNKDVALTAKKEVQAGNRNRNIRPSAVDHNLSVPVSNPLLRGKNVVDATGMESLKIDDSVSPASKKAMSNLYLQPSASSSLSANRLTPPKGQGSGAAPTGSSMFQPPQENNQANKVPPQTVQANQRNPVRSPGQPLIHVPGQQLAQRPLGGSQSSSPPKAGRGGIQGPGRGSLVYGSCQQAMGSVGNVGAGHGEPNMPAFFPVMQFGGQHPGGVGVPAVGMAFPGYVPPPNGLGSSEMTWLPVLASAASAMRASYCPPYLAVDGNYHPRPTGQASALPASSKENNLSKPSSEVKPQQRPEVAHDEYSQRQNKPRRYSEMSFSQ